MPDTKDIKSEGTNKMLTLKIEMPANFYQMDKAIEMIATLKADEFYGDDDVSVELVDCENGMAKIRFVEEDGYVVGWL